MPHSRAGLSFLFRWMNHHAMMCTRKDLQGFAVLRKYSDQLRRDAWSAEQGIIAEIVWTSFLPFPFLTYGMSLLLIDSSMYIQYIHIMHISIHVHMYIHRQFLNTVTHTLSPVLHPLGTRRKSKTEPTYIKPKKQSYDNRSFPAVK